MKYLTLCAVLGLGLLALSPLSHAQSQLINVQFGVGNPVPSPFTGQGVLTGATDLNGNVDWNPVYDSSTYSLNSSSGDSTSVTISGAQMDGGGGNYLAPSASLLNLFLNSVVFGYPTSTMTLSGLANGAYNVAIYNSGFTTTPTSYSINGATPIDLVGSDNFGSFQLGINYAVATATVSDGTMTIAIGGGAADAPSMNGFQIQEAPEPSTSALLLVVGLGFLAFWRARNSQTRISQTN